jgi:hypothetical protein
MNSPSSLLKSIALLLSLSLLLSNYAVAAATTRPSIAIQEPKLQDAKQTNPPFMAEAKSSILKVFQNAMKRDDSHTKNITSENSENSQKRETPKIELGKDKRKLEEDSAKTTNVEAKNPAETEKTPGKKIINVASLKEKTKIETQKLGIHRVEVTNTKNNITERKPIQPIMLAPEDRVGTFSSSLTQPPTPLKAAESLSGPKDKNGTSSPSTQQYSPVNENMPVPRDKNGTSSQSASPPSSTQQPSHVLAKENMPVANNKTGSPPSAQQPSSENFAVLKEKPGTSSTSPQQLSPIPANETKSASVPSSESKPEQGRSANAPTSNQDQTDFTPAKKQEDEPNARVGPTEGASFDEEANK